MTILAVWEASRRLGACDGVTMRLRWSGGSPSLALAWISLAAHSEVRKVVRTAASLRELLHDYKAVKSKLHHSPLRNIGLYITLRITRTLANPPQPSHHASSPDRTRIEKGPPGGLRRHRGHPPRVPEQDEGCRERITRGQE